jgi:hypothetical protein
VDGLKDQEHEEDVKMQDDPNMIKHVHFSGFLGL